MRDAFVTYGAAVGEASCAVEAASIDDLEALISDVIERSGRPVAMDPLARSDLETDIEDWLTDHTIERAWELAPALADLGWGNDDLEAIGDRFASSVAPVVAAITAAASAGTLLREIEEGAGRLSAIVKALKSYTYLDQAPVQVVDLVRGLDDTLLILGHKTKGIRIVREYADDLPTIEAYGSELNQVWTNLIDNAADAITQGGGDEGSTADGVITIRAFPSERGVVVEVEDNGPGIPDELQRRVFDSFFTTKPPGSGTGLGLDISRSIVMMRHGGSIDVASAPGSTLFRVELPLRPPA
jgi:signal transduction histidine kinase